MPEQGKLLRKHSREESEPDSWSAPPGVSQIDPRLTESEPEPRARSGIVQVPPEFERKRRGRPPGRPNAIAREADYESNPSVQLWNLAKVDRPITAVAVNIRHALTEASLHHDSQRAIYRLPCREHIYYVNGWITAKHIASQRTSYVNGLLIHSRGEDSAVSCVQCLERREKNALGPFLTCRVLPGTFHNSCSNCKWFDNTSACSLYTGPKPNRKRKGREEAMVSPGSIPDAGTTAEDGIMDMETTPAAAQVQQADRGD